ncbi:unnamed protein product, partial [Vitis vinifera]|uniref:Uncharacterized protein n=1 Tax=Vitis vinifera TaxID=29760 RepID=D7SPE7_VITVI
MIDIHMMCYRPKIRDYDSKPSVAQPAENPKSELLTVQGTCIIRVPSSILTVPIFAFANLCGFLLARESRWLAFLLESFGGTPTYASENLNYGGSKRDFNAERI